MRNESELTNMNKAGKAIYYMKTYGVGFVLRKVAKKLGIPIKDESVYQRWLRANEPSKKQLEQQRAANFMKKPGCCVLIDKIAADEQAAASTQKSIKTQTCAVEYRDTITKKLSVAEVLERYSSELFVFVKAGIVLRPQMIYELISLWEQKPEFACAYTDEDCSVKGEYTRPYFKPDMDEELILNFQYMGGVLAVSREALEKLPETDLWDNDWYDLALRLFELREKIYHIPKVLFSVRQKGREPRLYRDMSGKSLACIKAALERRGIRAKVQEGEVPGFYHVKYELPRKPLVSIIIPNKDHIAELSVCINGILHKNNYENYEVIIAENNSQEDETFHYYEKIQQEYKNIRVVYWTEEFNYSAINNFAAENAKGELLLFLNNDTEIIHPDCLEELVHCCYRDTVGAAGAMLYYPDNTIQHGGVVIGIGGFAAHTLLNLTDRDERYYPYSVTMREFSACTGACLMVVREIFERVGGFDEGLKVALNDIDLCLKIREAGQKIIFNPYARMYHYESKSRGYEDSAEKVERFNREIHLFQEKWKHLLEAGDPYYNKNQTLHEADYSVNC